ncbi:autoinducer 2 ABC transporter substrate-binding protein [Paenibacillus thiaminolyticus]|uniref:Autoinducer 2 ABC transporter substrate-binding protein n=1 Tax=Paenibacillus thiaminolyticus TaxID=49283 RepID=A0AAP9J270_PANTH|nr:autoinducer 2 ABC transporter substrate-binding protein [Paenibacillus thiaminolyticus]MCY9534309.1 autoinducer 2 ABC transporter substrate-binding protein [Paenibacillus thiaminolyticus]MCY9603020.1 autoinducer 2 ABC transporter substrate-binding protein [Paenibacillus thiaminolyticus]MCY9608251.1 autoinducer 2 ABC transporter substrate-binding protein [Paenibacillus thiaminolyticus]MCY9611619.1 autoinducer 2 ABC transporter substrate-binding protein [Paenibacillus thiaminolyticus]MCY96182
MKKGKLSMLLSIVLVVGMLAGCGAAKTENAGSTDASGSGNETAASGKLKIAIVPKLIGIPYFNASEQGAKQAGEDLGVEVIYTGPTQADAAQQVKVIEDLISKKVDVIAVAPNDPAALTPVLKKAKAQGIKVMDWDTKADPSVVDLSIQQVDDEVYGRHMADLLVKAMGKEQGNVAIVTGGLSAQNLNTWIDWSLKQIQEKYPNLNIIGEKIGTDEKQQVAYQKTLDLLKANPDLDGILAYSTVAPLGAAQAIQEKGLQDKVSLIGVALPTDSKPFLEDGSLDTATLWNPVNLGYLTVAAGKELAEGKTITNGQDIPNIGTVEVKEDGKTIILGPPADFTKENAGDYNF